MGGDEAGADAQAAFDAMLADQRLDVFTGLPRLAVDGECRAAAIQVGEFGKARLGNMAERAGRARGGAVADPRRLEDRDMASVPGERQRRRQASQAPTDDGDVDGVAGGCGGRDEGLQAVRPIGLGRESG